MRIRKNAKLSPLLFSSSSSSQDGSVPVETFQTHVCQLNQSPWDVIPFDSDSIQFEGEDSFTAGNGGGSAGDSIGAVESVASMMDGEGKSIPRIEGMAMEDDNHDSHDDEKGAAKMEMDDNGDKGVVAAKNSCCQGFDGKGWPCKNEAKHGQSFCKHHLSVLRSYNNSTHSSKKVAAAAVAAAAAAGARRARARAGKKTPSSNPYEFYYYSGFGPLWGKRRGDRNGEGSRNGAAGAAGGGGENSAMEESDNVISTPTPNTEAVVDNNNNNNSSSSIQSVEIDNNEEFDYVDDDEEEDANDDDSGKKRMRKPVKARSLKSLM